MNENGGGKLPGKTSFFGRRRNATRKSGFKSHPNATGGEFKVEKIPAHFLKKGQTANLSFIIPSEKGSMSGYGGWYLANSDVEVVIDDPENSPRTLTQPHSPDWSKFGSMWIASTEQPTTVSISLTAHSDSEIAFYMLGCGVIHHKHLEWAQNNKPVLLDNMDQFSPEANFYSSEGTVEIDEMPPSDQAVDLYLKSCNRCARFLPINVHNEREHLSFSNHCVAERRRPCRHPGFGKLKNVDTGRILNLEYGYQLECRFCKKYEVNAAHNPQRSAAQMKEDGARRRAIELLLSELEVSKLLQYRQDNQNKELAEDIWNRFDRRCFRCGVAISEPKEMHLDHTRPLALFWPLDESATCLCERCNSQKRDRPPVEFYSSKQLVTLSGITGVPLDELEKPNPNMDAVKRFLARLDWFFDEFLKRPELAKERDGKVPAELLVKALQKTLNKCEGGAPVDLRKMYRQRLGVN